MTRLEVLCDGFALCGLELHCCARAAPGFCDSIRKNVHGGKGFSRSAPKQMGRHPRHSLPDPVGPYSLACLAEPGLGNHLREKTLRREVAKGPVGSIWSLASGCLFGLARLEAEVSFVFFCVFFTTHRKFFHFELFNSQERVKGDASAFQVNRGRDL
jgi:hypothetical protein